jgi:hypothetical protein
MAPDLQIEVEKEKLSLIATEGVELGRMDMRFVPPHTSAIVACRARVRYQKSDRPGQRRTVRRCACDSDAASQIGSRQVSGAQCRLGACRARSILPITLAPLPLEGRGQGLGP